jgi:hypothetical protein
MLDNIQIKSFLAYIDRKTRRIVRVKDINEIIGTPTALTDYETRYVTVRKYDILTEMPYHFVFNNVHGLEYSPQNNVDIDHFKLINLRLEAIEKLWTIVYLFIKNISMQYLHNELITELIEYELLNKKDLEVDSMFSFLKTKFVNLDHAEYSDLIKLQLDHFYEKKKDITKNMLISQEKLLLSNNPATDLWNELKTIYIKY